MTNVQKQCLLKYLGYYSGEIDGKFGPASEQATRAFQGDYSLEADGKFGPLTEARILEVIASGETPRQAEDADTGDSQEGGTFWAGIRYFRREEFRCKCGGKYCDGFPAEPQEKLVRIADGVRDHFGKRITVSSGVRCETHNANVGGDSNSRHKLGKAMDFCVEGYSAGTVLAYVKQQEGIRYAYAIDGSYVHMDVK